MKNTRMPIILLAVLLLTASCSRMADPEGSSGPTETQATDVRLPPSHPGISGGGTLSGTITVKPSLRQKLSQTDVVYIIARSADMPGPPLAVQQVRNIQFPYAYTLSSADAMMPGVIFQGKVNILVRLDRDGAAGPPQPGDMEGAYSSNPATVGDRNVDIVIDKEF